MLGSYKKKTSLDHGLEGVSGTECHRFCANSTWSINSEDLEVCNFQRSRAVACTPREKEGTGPGAHGIGTSWVALPFLGYIWRTVYCLSMDKRPYR